MATLGRAARRRRLLVVPGGGSFADEVRRADRRFGLGDSAAHWMAILAMDQYGHLLARLAPGAALVRHPRGVKPGRLNILLPSSWLVDADPLPHSWDVTSDSIAAWVAGAAGARRLVLVKPVADGGVDAHLEHVLRRTPVETWVIDGREPARLAELLDTGRTTGTVVSPA